MVKKITLFFFFVFGLTTISFENAAASPIPKPYWPETEVPKFLKKYEDGNIVNWARIPELVIVVNQTNISALKTYIRDLKNLGWIQQDDNYRTVTNGFYRVDFQFTDPGQTILQISVYEGMAGLWPEELEDDLAPPENCILIDLVEPKRNENDWTFRFTCKGIDEQAVDLYEKQLLSKGYKGFIYDNVYKDVHFRGKKRTLFVSYVETKGDVSTFSCDII